MTSEKRRRSYPKGIYRSDYEYICHGKIRQVHAWNCRIGGCRVLCKRFTDCAYGGREAAFVAAMKWMVKEHKRSGLEYREGNVWTRPKRGNSLPVGIYRIVVKSRAIRSQSSDVHYFRASWVDSGGRQHLRRYSIKRYGEARALEMAIEAREAGMLELRRARSIRSSARKALRNEFAWSELLRRANDG